MRIWSYLGINKSLPLCVTHGTVLREPYQRAFYLIGAGTMGTTPQVPAWFPEVGPATLEVTPHL